MWPFTKNQRVEDPDRLQRFLDQLNLANWQTDQRTALNSTFVALNELIHHEVLFYYRARKKQRWFSIITRGTAIVLATVGVMIPLLAGADSKLFGVASPYGYPLLVAAGATLAINRMFGATGGHIRYVTAQLELERLITKFRLAWLTYLARQDNTLGTSNTAAEALNLMNNFVDQAYRVIQEETQVWGKSISEALQEQQAYLPSKLAPTDAPPPVGISILPPSEAG